MKPKTPVRQAQRELFRIELERLVGEGHPLVKLGRQINWTVFEERLGQTYAVTGEAPRGEHEANGGAALPEVSA